jgi:SPP1 family predicted phage head-tail adaptor
VSIAGLLREQVTIQAPTRTQTASGDVVDTFATIATTRARIEPIKASDVVRAMREVTERRYRMTIRQRSDLPSVTRVIWRGRTMLTDGDWNPDERRQFLMIDLKEVDPASS